VLTVVEVKGTKYVRLSEFYDQMELSRRKYYDFVRRHITDHQIPEKTIDFIEISPKKHNMGRPRLDYLISIGFLKTLCFSVKSSKSKRVKRWADAFSDFTLI
jgi:phage anti-repressor protein